MTDQGGVMRMDATGWHVAVEDLRQYARQDLAAPRLWSVETHLAACRRCRAELAEVIDPELVTAGWARLDAELDAPRPGLMEAALIRLGVADHTARLLVATPTLRRSWLAAVVVTLALAVIAGNAARHGPVPLLFVGVVPLLPVAGVALAFGAGIDPTYEMALVAPMHFLRLLLLRTVSVLAPTTSLSLLASLALPSFGLAALAWLLPALALTSLSLVLMPRLGPFLGSGLVGAGWVVTAWASDTFSSGTPPPFTLAGQLAAALTVVAVATALAALKDRFDTFVPFALRRQP